MSPKARIEVFRTGTFTPMKGKALTFTAADLRAMADAYDFATAPAPVVVGHPTTDAPAFGWAEKFEYDATTDRLYADVGDLDPSFAEQVKAGRYKKVSLSFFQPANAANPVPGTFYPKHIGFLGGAAPAVSGLQNVQFSNDDDATTVIAFGEPGFEQAASMFQRMREFFIEQFGMEVADRALPSWEIEWLGDIEVKPRDPDPAYSAPTDPNPKPEKEPAVKPQTDPAIVAREADYERRMAALTDAEKARQETENASFAEGLVTEGRLLPALKGKVVAILNALPTDASVSFAEGEEEISPVEAIRQVLSEQPKIVNFGTIDMPDAQNGGTASFASDGREVDQDQLVIHEKALAYQRQHPGTAYIAAVQAVS